MTPSCFGRGRRNNKQKNKQTKMIKLKIDKRIFEKIGEQKVEKVLAYSFLFIFLLMVFYIKILGASNIPELVEKDGYCKTAYGDGWYYNELEEYCFNKEIKTFTEEQFRSVCPKNKFLSKQFYSDCFRNGDNR